MPSAGRGSQVSARAIIQPPAAAGNGADWQKTANFEAALRWTVNGQWTAMVVTVFLP